MEGVSSFFEFYIHQKLNVPNVNFITFVEFLVKEMEFKVEFDTIFSIIEYTTLLNQRLQTSITTVNPVFIEVPDVPRMTELLEESK
jgi:hypothetical protein